jgi:hypothetical protein
VALDHARVLEVVPDVRGNLDDLRGAARGLGNERLRTDQDDLRVGALQLDVDDLRSAEDLGLRPVGRQHIGRVAHQRRGGARLEAPRDVTRVVRAREQQQVRLMLGNQLVQGLDPGLRQMCVEHLIVRGVDGLGAVLAERRGGRFRPGAQHDGGDRVAEVPSFRQELEGGSGRAAGTVELRVHPDCRHR